MLSLTIKGEIKTFHSFTSIYNFIKGIGSRDYEALTSEEKNEVIENALNLLKSMPYDFDIADYYKNLLTSLKTTKEVA